MFFVRINLFVLFTFCSYRICNTYEIKGPNDNSVVKDISRELEIKWSKNFGSVTSSNVPYNCNYNGKPICCNSLRDSSNDYGQDISFFSTLHSNDKHARHHCSTERIYLQSPYEEGQFQMAKKLSMIDDAKIRRSLLVDFITSQEQIDSANIWLEMVKNQMMNSTYEIENVHMYLSRFRITKHCSSPTKRSYTWDEWIEPLTVHTRHPFSVSGCGNNDVYDIFSKKDNYHGAVDIMNVDYILVQSAASFKNDTDSRSPLHLAQIANRPIKKFLFDAGTSTFESSLMWFTCAYSQVNCIKV